MSAPELPTFLKEIATALEEKTRFPIEFWEHTPAESLVKLIAEQELFGTISRQDVEIAITSWQAKVTKTKEDNARQKSRIERMAGHEDYSPRGSIPMRPLSIFPDGDGDAKSKYRAIEAYEARDAEASRREHDKSLIRGGPHGKEPHMGSASDYIKSIVFGALDGIVTTFAVVSAAQGGNFKNKGEVILIMGFANLFGDGFSMGFGEFVGSTAEMDHVKTERKREEWEVDQYIEGEKKEMVDLYMEKGLSEEDANTVVNVISKDKKVFVDIMMVEELGLLPIDDDDKWAPVKQGAVMFTSFCTFGTVPLLAYTSGKDEGYIFGIAVALVAIALFVLGFIKGKLTAQNPIKTGAIMIVNGGISAGMSYVVAVFVAQVFGLEA